MKKNISILLLLITALFYGCKDEISSYSDTANRLNFNFDPTSTDSVVYHTFVYEPVAKVLDTILISVKTMGFVVNYDRPVILEQVICGERNAEPGKHYIPFNDPSIASEYFIPAGKATISLPIYVKRDPSLKTQQVKLIIRFAENSYFLQGYDFKSKRVILISDQLSKPITWSSNITSYMTGPYGQVKHQFMIDVTGMKIDEDYFRSILKPATDVNYLKYLGNWYSQKLEEYNAQHKEPLREADGTEVKFKKS